MTNNFDEFCRKFDIVENALAMRTLIRWNGRDLRETENLAEHTHLVVCCAIDLYDLFTGVKPSLKRLINFETLIKLCMIHDSLELLRGDILSVTKDEIKGLRQKIDVEENEFRNRLIGEHNEITDDLVRLADLKACYKFVEYELRFPSNDFAREAYLSTKNKYDTKLEEFVQKYKVVKSKELNLNKCDTSFAKGYFDDAGTDIILKEDVTFMPMSTSTVNLKVKVTPKEGEMAILCSRTSAANKGIIVATCPIDPNYTGDVLGIVHNISNQVVEYFSGESFCQVVMVPINNFIENTNEKVLIKKSGTRSNGNLGSTGDLK